MSVHLRLNFFLSSSPLPRPNHYRILSLTIQHDIVCTVSCVKSSREHYSSKTSSLVVLLIVLLTEISCLFIDDSTALITRDDEILVRISECTSGSVSAV